MEAWVSSKQDLRSFAYLAAVSMYLLMRYTKKAVVMAAFMVFTST